MLLLPHVAEQDAGEADLAAGLGADPDRDLVEPFAASVLDIDKAPERLRDRGGEVATGELLGTVVEREVSVGDVDRLVRHVDIVTPFGRTNYTWEYTYIHAAGKPRCYDGADFEGVRGGLVHMRSGARVVFLLLSWLFVVGLVGQVFLAGLGVFESPARFSVHRDVGYTLSILPILMVVAAVLGGVGRRAVLLSLTAFLLFILQSVLIAMRTSSPTVAALHPVNGFLILVIALVIARDAWFARRPATA